MSANEWGLELLLNVAGASNVAACLNPTPCPRNLKPKSRWRKHIGRTSGTWRLLETEDLLRASQTHLGEIPLLYVYCPKIANINLEYSILPLEYTYVTQEVNIESRVDTEDLLRASPTHLGEVPLLYVYCYILYVYHPRLHVYYPIVYYTTLEYTYITPEYTYVTLEVPQRVSGLELEQRLVDTEDLLRASQTHLGEVPLSTQ